MKSSQLGYIKRFKYDRKKCEMELEVTCENILVDRTIKNMIYNKHFKKFFQYNNIPLDTAIDNLDSSVYIILKYNIDDELVISPITRNDIYKGSFTKILDTKNFKVI